MKAKSKSILREILDSTDHQLIDRLHKEFYKLEIEFNPKLNRSIIDFVQMKSHFLAYRKFQSKRKLESNLRARMNLIRSVCRQVKRDKEYFDNPISDDFLNRHLFIALIENAVLIDEKLNKKSPTDTLAFGFHLWHFKRLLVQQGIVKPVETIAAIFEKTGAVQGISAGWGVATIQNKISKVQELVDASKRLGACHDPRQIWEYPKTDSLLFIKTISGGCENCVEAWQKVIRIKKSDESSFKAAAKDLSTKYPEVADRISDFTTQLQEMPLKEILDRTPRHLRGVMGFATR